MTLWAYKVRHTSIVCSELDFDPLLVLSITSTLCFSFCHAFLQSFTAEHFLLSCLSRWGLH